MHETGNAYAPSGVALRGLHAETGAHRRIRWAFSPVVCQAGWRSVKIVPAMTNSPRSSARGTSIPHLAAGRRLNRTDFAWEFLRRNPGFRRVANARAWTRGEDLEETAARAWGLRFLADPDLPAPEAPVFWRPDLTPGLVMDLEVASGVAAAHPLQACVAHQRLARDGLHVRLKTGQQLLVQGADLSAPLAALLPLSGSFSAHLRAAEGLRRVLSGRPDPLDDLTEPQRMRLRRMLAAFDGAERQATYRQIATEIFGEAAVAREIWRTSSLRDVVIRLVRSGRGLVAGGYLRLLKAGDQQAPDRSGA